MGLPAVVMMASAARGLGEGEVDGAVVDVVVLYGCCRTVWISFKLAVGTNLQALLLSMSNVRTTHTDH